MHIDFGLYISVIYTTLSGGGAKIVGAILRPQFSRRPNSSAGLATGDTKAIHGFA